MMLDRKPMYLGIDCGTQGTKALLIDADGRALGRGHAPHHLIEAAGGRREQQPSWWIAAAETAICKAIAQAGPAHVAGIGVSGQQHGLVILDEDKRVIRPAKLWNDTEAAPQNDSLLAAFGGNADWLERFGIAPLTGYTVSKLLWLKQLEPDNFARIRHILLPHDYLNFWLTGIIAAEWGDASGTGFFDPRTRQWIPEILDFIDGGAGHLRAALPPLLAPGESIGRVLPEISLSLGIDAGAVVSVGGGDNMMGAIGTGNLRPGVVTVSLGTSSTVYSFHDHPPTRQLAAIAPFCSSSGAWLPLVCTMNCTNIVSATLALLGNTVDEIDKALDATPPGADGLTFLPFLNGERAPDLPSATGALVGITALNYTPAHLLRATIEGVTFGIVAGMQHILEGKPADQILLIGGGARSRAWRQLLADVTGAVIDTPIEDEAGCLGAAIQAIYTVAKQAGETTTLQQIASRCIALDPTRRAMPTREVAAAYASALALYLERRATLYGV